MDPDGAHQRATRHERLDGRLRRAAFRLEMAQVERSWAVVSAKREGMSVREIAKSVGLSPTRVHQLLTDPAGEMLEHAFSALRELGWPAPEDGSAMDGELVADRLVDEARLLMSCAGWLEQLAAGGHPPIINLRPDSDWPNTDNVAMDQARVVRILRRVASDVDELARARRVADLSSTAVDAHPRLNRRRRLGEPPIEFHKGPKSVLHMRQAWDDYERRLRQAGLPMSPDPWRHLDPPQDIRTAHPSARPGAEVPNALKIAKVLLWLRVENNSKFVRGKKRAREDIERHHLDRYAVERRPSGEYELKVPFRDDEDLDKTMWELFREMENQAELRYCFTEASAHLEDDEERSW